MKKFQVITLFPGMFSPVFESSMMWKAQQQRLVALSTIDLRDFGLGPRKQVDDTPYGGGDGMLLMIEPLVSAVQYAKTQDPAAKVVLMTPRGWLWTQAAARQWAGVDNDHFNSHDPPVKNHDNSSDGFIFICGRYEGYDERIVDYVDEEVRVGDYVLTGGELPAMTIIDSVVRLIPGVLGGEQSSIIESFSQDNILEFPQYTRPRVFNEQAVPSVLLSGDHAKIAKWRQLHSKRLEKNEKEG